MTFFLLLLPPLLAALLAAVVRPYRSWVGWVNACLSLLPLAAALIFASQAVAGHEAFSVSARGASCRRLPTMPRMR